MKKLNSLILLLIFIFELIPIKVSAKESAPLVSADSAVLMDAETGKILYSKNPDSAYPPASTTKIMTALLTLERCNLNDVVKVGKNPPRVDGSKIYIFQDEEIKVKDLLYALLLASANDCAEALAEHMGGSIDNFAKIMNERAKDLGCTNTNFVNPSGLYDENHKTSAKDLALILRELSKHPEYKEISTTLSYKIPPTNKSNKERPLYNENKLVQKYSRQYYEGCEGGKTGYTVKSQHSYVAAATRNGQKLIVALVHDSRKTFFYDAAVLFNYGFNNYELTKMYSKGEQISNFTSGNLNIPLYAENDFYYVKEKSDTDIPKLNIMNKDLNNVSFKAGDKILLADITYKDKSIGKLSLISGIDHELTISAKITSAPNKTRFFVILISIFAVFFSVILSTIIIKKIKYIKSIKEKG